MAGRAQALEADPEAEYADDRRSTWTTSLSRSLCAPNDPDDARLLSEVAGDKVDEVFIGSLHDQHRALPRRGQAAQGLTRGAAAHAALGRAADQDGRGAAHRRGLLRDLRHGGRAHEMPGCSLCMGNQARVAEKTTVSRTSTRNFPNRLGKGANVYLASAELAAVAAIIGKLPDPEEYLEYAGKLDATAADTYRYLNFDKLKQYVKAGEKV